MAGESITVGCFLPHGLHLDTVLHGKKARVTVMGRNKARIIGGAGLTTIPKEHWDAWFADHKDAAYLRSGVVYAVPSARDAEREAENRASIKTGFEGADPVDAGRQIRQLVRE